MAGAVAGVGLGVAAGWGVVAVGTTGLAVGAVPDPLAADVAPAEAVARGVVVPCGVPVAVAFVGEGVDVPGEGLAVAVAVAEAVVVALGEASAAGNIVGAPPATFRTSTTPESAIVPRSCACTARKLVTGTAATARFGSPPWTSARNPGNQAYARAETATDATSAPLARLGHEGLLHAQSLGMRRRVSP